jgi:hypothetical protein
MTNGRITMVAWRGTGGKRNLTVFIGKAVGTFAPVQPQNTADKKEYVGEDAKSYDSIFDKGWFADVSFCGRLSHKP